MGGTYRSPGPTPAVLPAPYAEAAAKTQNGP
jgi:hypothetical protein